MNEQKPHDSDRVDRDRQHTAGQADGPRHPDPPAAAVSGAPPRDTGVLPADSALLEYPQLVGDARLAEAAKPAFARHETFPPRFGWLGKGYTAAAADPGIFLRDDAPVTLGVGKNMVRAIRYWMAAFKLTDERSRGNTVPAWEAHWLLSDNGADPYLEDQASLWLLHWWLLSPRSSAPTWWITFNTWGSFRFQAEDLAQHVAHQAEQAGWQPPARASVDRDIDCLTRMYALRAPTRRSADLEDILNCPFRELSLLDEVPAGQPGRERQWRLSPPGPGTVPDAVVAYACLDYARRHGRAAAGSVSLARLAREAGSPGRAFLLTEQVLTDVLEETGARYPAIFVAHSAAGQTLLTFSSDPRAVAWDILDAHYGGARGRVATRAEWAARFPVPDPAPRPVPAGRRLAGRSPGQATLPGFELDASRLRRLRGTARTRHGRRDGWRAAGGHAGASAPPSC